MFERFTASARGTVVRAQQEAVDAGDRHIGTEHVVVALAQDDGVAGAVLRDAGVTAASLRRWRAGGRRRQRRPVSTPTRSGASGSTSTTCGAGSRRRSAPARWTTSPNEPVGRRWGGNKHIPFTRRAKKSLERGLRQAIMLGDTRIGSEHLLLGVLDEGSGLGVRMLRDEGVDLAQLRATTLERSRRSA